MDIQATKLELIKIIADIESEQFLEEIKVFLIREAILEGQPLPPGFTANNSGKDDPE